MKKISIVSVVLCLVVANVSFAAVGGGDLTFTAKGAKPVYFSHVKHVEGKKFKCSACHYTVFQMAKGSYKMDMSKINKGQFCGICHNGERSFGVLDKASCVKCHI